MTRVAKALTKERHKTHGRFEDVAATSESLLKVMQASVNWSSMSPQRREAIKMITHKLARIGAGNPAEPDHWDDIGGYALLGKQDGQNVVKLKPIRTAAVAKKAAAKRVKAKAPAKKRVAKKAATRSRVRPAASAPRANRRVAAGAARPAAARTRRVNQSAAPVAPATAVATEA